MSESKANLRDERDKLLARLQDVYRWHQEASDEVDRLKQTLLVPTEAMLDAARFIMMVVDATPRTLGTWREHVKRCGGSLESWPTWAREGHDSEHIAKSGMADIIWHVMAAKAVRP